MSFDSVITPETKKIVENEGMPVVKERYTQIFGPGGNQIERGLLNVDFIIEFRAIFLRIKKQV